MSTLVVVDYPIIIFAPAKMDKFYKFYFPIMDEAT